MKSVMSRRVRETLANPKTRKAFSDAVEAVAKRRVLPIARFAGDIKTSAIWDRMGY